MQTFQRMALGIFGWMCFYLPLVRTALASGISAGADTNEVRSCCVNHKAVADD